MKRFFFLFAYLWTIIVQVSAQSDDFTVSADSVCFNASTSLHLTGGGSASIKLVRWDLNNDGIFSDAEGAKVRFIFAMLENNKAQAEITLSDNTVHYSKMQDIVIKPVPSATVIIKNQCVGSNTSFIVKNKINVASTSWIVNYLSTSGVKGSTVIESDTARYNFDTTGIFGVTLKLHGTNTCLAVIDTSVQIFPGMSISVTGNKVLCVADTVHLNALVMLSSSGVVTNKIWHWGDSTMNFGRDGIHVYKHPGTFNVQFSAVSAANCKDSVQTSVTIGALPSLKIYPADTAYTQGETVNLRAEGNFATIQWIGGSASQNYSFVADRDTIITAQASSEIGCKSKSTSTVKVKAVPVEMIISKLVTPNGDGENDFFVIQDLAYWKDCSLEIYSESGIKVFSTDVYRNDWDCQYNGKMIPDGVYSYRLKSNTKEITDVFTVLTK